MATAAALMIMLPGIAKNIMTEVSVMRLRLSSVNSTVRVFEAIASAAGLDNHNLSAREKLMLRTGALRATRYSIDEQEWN